MIYEKMTAADVDRIARLYTDYYNQHEDGCWTHEKACRRIRQIVTVEVLDETDDAGGLGRRAVAGDGDEIHVDRAVHAAAQINVEKRRALEHAHQHGALVAKLGGQISAELLDAGGDGFLGKKDAFNVLFGRSDEHNFLQISRRTGVVNVPIIMEDRK